MNIDRPSQSPHSHLFTVRVWQEEIDRDQTEWRGKVQLLTSGDVRYFRHWAALVPLLVTLLSELEPQPEATRETSSEEQKTARQHVYEESNGKGTSHQP